MKWRNGKRESQYRKLRICIDRGLATWRLGAECFLIISCISLCLCVLWLILVPIHKPGCSRSPRRELSVVRVVHVPSLFISECATVFQIPPIRTSPCFWCFSSGQSRAVNGYLSPFPKGMNGDEQSVGQFDFKVVFSCFDFFRQS